MSLNALQIALNNIGHSNVARACRISRQAVKQWSNKGRLPDTEYLPKDRAERTDYTKIISKLARCSREDLLK